MQRFTPNSYMANIHNLDDATGFYAGIMNLFTRYEEHLAFEYHPLRYEDVVHSLDDTEKDVIQFLGLEWNDSVLDYRRHAN